MIENFECTVTDSWNNLTEEQQLLTEISDVYKDINGFRPRGILNRLNTVEKLQNLLDDLYKQAEDQFISDKQEQLENVVNFEDDLKNIMKICSCDRDSAIRYILDAEDETDVEYIEYVYNLPFGYLVQKNED
jgi:hypothetical protein